MLTEHYTLSLLKLKMLFAQKILNSFFLRKGPLWKIENFAEIPYFRKDRVFSPRAPKGFIVPCLNLEI